MTFGERLKELRNRADVGVRELARRMDYYPSYIVRIETGKAYPTIRRILDIADALDLTDEQTEELVARRMAERYDCGDAWEMWEMPAARVIAEVRS